MAAYDRTFLANRLMIADEFIACSRLVCGPVVRPARVKTSSGNVDTRLLLRLKRTEKGPPHARNQNIGEAFRIVAERLLLLLEYEARRKDEEAAQAFKSGPSVPYGIPINAIAGPTVGGGRRVASSGKVKLLQGLKVVDRGVLLSYHP